MVRLLQTRTPSHIYSDGVPALLPLLMLAKLLSSLPSLGHFGSGSGLLGFAAAAAELDGEPPVGAAPAPAGGGGGGIEPTFRVRAQLNTCCCGMTGSMLQL
jgi:hypothetical protein